MRYGAQVASHCPTDDAPEFTLYTQPHVFSSVRLSPAMALHTPSTEYLRDLSRTCLLAAEAIEAAQAEQALRS